MQLEMVILLLSPFVGSFLGLLVMRLPEGVSVIFGRSRCGACGVTLQWFDLIPVVSWFLLGRKCRACGARLSVFYPAIELAAFAIALWAVAATDGWVSFMSAAFGWWLLVLGMIDWRYFILPDRLTLPLIPLGLAAVGYLNPDLVPDAVIGAVAGFFLFTLLGWGYEKICGREGLGFGDVKLAAVAGAWLGWQGLPSAILIAALSGILVTLINGVRSGQLDAKQKLPFGSYLCAGIWITWLHGLVVLW